jgi:hypothetical protein
VTGNGRGLVAYFQNGSEMHFGGHHFIVGQRRLFQRNLVGIWVRARLGRKIASPPATQCIYCIHMIEIINGADRGVTLSE